MKINEIQTYSKEYIYVKDLKEWAKKCIEEVEASSDYQIKKDAKIEWIKEAFDLDVEC